jgi:hypothetical protein
MNAALDEGLLYQAISQTAAGKEVGVTPDF